MLDDSCSNRQGPSSVSSVSPSILHLDPHFVVLDKPYDVRMDGDHTVTVEKLLQHWHQEGTLTAPAFSNSSTVISSRDLFPSSTPPFKWVHQLDYATSGALCVALSRDGAAAACSSFQLRRVKKQYLAVLYGHLNVKDLSQYEEKKEIVNLYEEDGEEKTKGGQSNNSSVVAPKLVSSITTTNSDYYSKRKATQRSLNKTFQSNDTWQNELMLENLKLSFTALQSFLLKYPSEDSFKQLLISDLGLSEPIKPTDSEEKPKSEKLEEETDGNKKKKAKFQSEGSSSLFTSLLSDFHAFRESSFEGLTINHKLRKSLRKFLSKCGVEHAVISEEDFKKDFFEKKAKEEEDSENLPDNSSSATTRSSFTPPLPLDDLQIESILDFYRSLSEINKETPPIYRIPSDSSSIYSADEVNAKDNPDNQFIIIDIPLADYDTNEFKVIPGIPAAFGDQYRSFLSDHASKYSRLHPDKLYYPEGKRSLTKLEVLSTGYFNGNIPVTKVLLTPLTGRRHQLRVHCRSIGFPILNDFTYNKIQLEKGHYTSKRMALHSFRLTIRPSTKISQGLKNYLLLQQSSFETQQGEGEEGKTSGKAQQIDLERPFVSVETVDPFPFVEDQLKI